MQKYDKIWIPSSFEESNATVHSGGKFLADCAMTKENVIVLTVEELRDIFRNARRKVERGDAPYIFPQLEDYLQSKGINIEG